MILGYIDPGLGMLIWQAIVSAFVGFLFYVKKSRDFIVGLGSRIFRRQKPRHEVVTDTVKPSSVPIEAEVKAR